MPMPSKKHLFYCCCCICIFFIIGLIIFSLTKNKTNTKNKEQFNETDKTITVMLFKADWCGHCKNFNPEWQKFKNIHSNCKEYDADKNHKENKEFNVNSYPTILVKVNDEKPIQYTGERTSDALETYVNSLY